MSDRALPQASRKNVLLVFAELFRPDQFTSFSNRALAEAGVGQARHTHALLTFLGLLEGTGPAAEVSRRRGSFESFAELVRQSVCRAYESRLGNMDFLFDEANNETVRSTLKQRVRRAVQLHERNVAQVVNCLMSLREVHGRFERGDDDWLGPEREPAPEEADAAAETSPPNGEPESPRNHARAGPPPLPPAAVEEQSAHHSSGNGTPTAETANLLERLAGRLAESPRRFILHARHLHMDPQTNLRLDDVDITME